MALTTVFTVAQPGAAQTQNFFDDFNGPSLSSAWYYLNANEILGQTARKGQPAFRSETVGGVTTNYVRLRHDTYNPNVDAYGNSLAGKYFLGVDFWTNKKWSVGTAAGNALEFTARIRLTALRSGMIGAFFTYNSGNSRGDEIDYEFLGNLLNPNITTKQYWLNSWNNADQAFNYTNVRTNVPAGVDVTQWQTYRIRWQPDRVQWWLYYNGAWQVIRQEFTVVPNENMGLEFSTWAPTSAIFLEAYDGSYLPTASPGQVHYFDVDWVRVTKFGGASLPESGPGVDQSPVFLSSVAANVSSQTVNLTFTGALDPVVAADKSRYIAAIFGGTTLIENASYVADSNMVVLQLGTDSLHVGDEVRASSYGLKDAKGLTLADQNSDPVKAQ